MKIRLILATNDREYAQRFTAGMSDTLNTVSISVCTNLLHLNDMLREGRYDICLADPDVVPELRSEDVKLAVMLWSPQTDFSPAGDNYPKVNKYQRISAIVSHLIRLYAEVADQYAVSGDRANITVVWSPAGGCGKTTVAAAYAARMAKLGKTVTYLDLENFSSTEALFSQSGISLSAVFEQMANNMGLQLLGMRTTDASSGIHYFGMPDNYDDMNVLSEEDCIKIVKAAAENTEELVLDLSSQCDRRTLALMNEATRILLVADYSKTSEIKLQQFMHQSNTFHRFQNKMTLVANKGAGFKNMDALPVSRLPMVDTKDMAVIYNKLSEYSI